MCKKSTTATMEALESKVGERMKLGRLFYDSSEQRINIRFQDDTFSGGLRCGDGLEFRTVDFSTSRLGEEKWVSTRLEYDHTGEDWYLEGLYGPGEIPVDNLVRK